MKIFITAKPGAREEKVEKISETEYAVSVKEPPIEGRANRAILSALAIYFKVPVSRIRIAVGHTSRKKIIEII